MLLAVLEYWRNRVKPSFLREEPGLELLESEKASQKALFRRRSLPIDSKGSWTAAARTDSGIIDVDGG